MDKDDKGRALKLLEELLLIPSPTGEEGRLLQRLKSELSQRGLSCEVQTGQGGVRNLLARRGRPEILVATHLDTVPAWNHPHAFSPRVEGTKVWGRGALDAKGQIVALLLALEGSEANCLVALFSDEEGEGRGSRAFSPPSGLELRGAIVLEPTGLRLAVAEAGSVEVKVKVRGRAAHGALPSSGENAIERFFRIWSELGTLSFLSLKHPLFPPFGVNLGSIKGGIDPQVVPESCEAEIDIPVPPGVGLQEAEKEVMGFFEDRGVEVQVRDCEPPWQMEEGEGEFLQLVSEAYRRALGRPPELWGMPSWTDAANLRNKGIPSFVMGAGELALAHTPEEHVEIEEVLKLSSILREVLRLASGQGPL